MPARSYCSIIKCCERYLCAQTSVNQPLATNSKLVEYICSKVEFENKEVKSTAAKAILRISVHKVYRSLIQKTHMKIASFEMVNMPAKIVKYLKQVNMNNHPNAQKLVCRYWGHIT